MERLFRVLTVLEKEPRFASLLYLIDEIKRHIGFSFVIINGQRRICILDPIFISIIQKCFPGKKLSINSYVSEYSILS